ncbi:hypothetical protein [Bradyrhizobium sp. USDA 4353]
MCQISFRGTNASPVMEKQALRHRHPNVTGTMGSFITNLHVRDAEPAAVIDALRSLAVVPAYIRRAPGDRWTSLYPEAAFQDDVALSEIAHALSTALQRPVIGFIVHDSDILLYVLVDHGKLLDSYNSAPGFFTGESLAPTGGQAEVVAAYCEADDAHDRLSRLLHPETLSRNDAQPTQNDVLEAVRKKVIQSYPKMAAQDPNTPPLSSSWPKSRGASQRSRSLRQPSHPRQDPSFSKKTG